MIAIISVSILTVTMINSIYLARFHDNCKYFDEGFGKVKYDQLDCKIKIPDTCYYEIFDGLLSMDNFVNQDDCSKIT